MMLVYNYICNGQSLTTKFKVDTIFDIEKKINMNIDAYVNSNVALQTVRQLFRSINKWCVYFQYLQTDPKAKLDGFRKRTALSLSRANHDLWNGSKQRTLNK